MLKKKKTTCQFFMECRCRLFVFAFAKMDGGDETFETQLIVKNEIIIKPIKMKEVI